jgi:glycosyltransferase involved in cell wall biosynthesis
MNNSRRLKVLLIIEQCNPAKFSVPLVGYCFYEQISRWADTVLVTHERNRRDLDAVHPDRDIVYIPESEFIKRYHKLVLWLSTWGGQRIWPIYNTLVYPIYAEFNQRAYARFRQSIRQGEYDLVHAITPMMPRYPVKCVRACRDTPFILGPVNGGVPFPPGFQEVARQEFSYLNFLREIGRFVVPGYRETYQKAAYILSGSSYTLNFIRQLFGIRADKIDLFYENGIRSSFLKKDVAIATQPASELCPVNLLFVGRLVPYKGADMLIAALAKLDPAVLAKVVLKVVGDGGERPRLETQVQELNLTEKVEFVGWVEQQETLKYYHAADVFCFPSVREFGGAVVLEAMANGLPCVVVNNGGIGEYVTEETGFKIAPRSRSFVIQELARCIEILVNDHHLRQQMSVQAIERVREFTWEAKGKAIINLYEKVLMRS